MADVEADRAAKAARAKAMPADNDDSELRSLIRTQKQTIDLLNSEKSSLSASYERLQAVEKESQQTKKDLAQSHQQIQTLTTRATDAEGKLTNTQRELQAAKQQQGEFLNNHQAQQKQEMQLESSKRSTNDLRSQLGKTQRRLQDLEEQIQADDRVENLEKSLQGANDRADSLEAALSKLRQTHGQIKSERDTFDNDLKALKTAESDLRTKYSTTEKQLAEATKRDSISKDHDALKAQLSTAQGSSSELQKSASRTATELADAQRSLANRTGRSLQTENVALVAQLDEVRPKIVELTGQKQRKIRAQDEQIATLENKEAELRSQAEHGTRSATAAYAELQKELANAQKGSRDLDAERSSHRAAAIRAQQELTQRTRDATAARRAGEELQEHVQSAQTDILMRDDEVTRLRTELAAAVAAAKRKASQDSPDATTPAGQTLDGEMLGALRTQHALDMSNAHATIRALENQTFEAQAKSHGLQKRVSTLEDELAHAKLSMHQFQQELEQLKPQTPLSPNPAVEYGVAATPQRGPNSDNGRAVPVVRSAISLDDSLTPETRHKRQVSLSMLKARIDSERARQLGATSPRPLARNLSNLSSLTESNMENEEPLPPGEGHDEFVHVHDRRPQFLDDSHVFWCHACRGDIVVL
ncbi:hypothetical protein BKA62DRAFT_740637 [Auriculariales sp. MPI-PUGE-AT-0066]|nr:hypothetical protein BKA62DRAFT_740637 [Auriculariales sp. MPI-PUGE-AT-0066]